MDWLLPANLYQHWSFESRDASAGRLGICQILSVSGILLLCLRPLCQHRPDKISVRRAVSVKLSILLKNLVH
jgi:hypothetical protein